MKQGLTVPQAVVSLCSYQFYIVWYLWHSIESDKGIWHCQAIAAALSCNQSTFPESMDFVVLYISNVTSFLDLFHPFFFLSQGGMQATPSLKLSFLYQDLHLCLLVFRLPEIKEPSGLSELRMR